MGRPARLVLTFSLLSVAACAPTAMGSGGMAVARSSSSAQLHDAMRKLWTDHVVWTRL